MGRGEGSGACVGCRGWVEDGPEGADDGPVRPRVVLLNGSIVDLETPTRVFSV